MHEDDALKLMSAAYDAGINFFDNAEGYESGKSKELMGKHCVNWPGHATPSSFQAKCFGVAVSQPSMACRASTLLMAVMWH